MWKTKYSLLTYIIQSYNQKCNYFIQITLYVNGLYYSTIYFTFVLVSYNHMKF